MRKKKKLRIFCVRKNHFADVEDEIISKAKRKRFFVFPLEVIQLGEI